MLSRCLVSNNAFVHPTQSRTRHGYPTDAEEMLYIDRITWIRSTTSILTGHVTKGFQVLLSFYLSETTMITAGVKTNINKNLWLDLVGLIRPKTKYEVCNPTLC